MSGCHRRGFASTCRCAIEGEHRRGREDGLALVGEVDGTAVAFVLAVPKDGCGHLLEIAVAQPHQGQGYGRRLIAAVETWAQEEGFTEVTLTTFCHVPWNAPFYEKLGYEVTEVGSDRPELATVIADEQQAGLHQAPRVTMRKSISPEMQWPCDQRERGTE